MLKLLDRYILRKFLSIFFLTLLAFLVIFNIVDLIEKLDKFLKNQLPPKLIAQYYLNLLPFYANLALPMALLLAAVFTIGTFVKHNELTAIKSSGISLYRVATPMLIVGFLLSVGSIFFEDLVVIPATRVRMGIEANNLRRYRYAEQTIFTNIMFQDSPECNIVISIFNRRENAAFNVTIQYSQQQRLQRRLDARRMFWLPDQKLWQIQDFKLRLFDSEGNERVSQIIADSTIKLNLTPEDIVKTNLNPETMRIGELRYFIRRLHESGNEVRKWEVNLHFKLAFAFTNFIVVLFGVPLAAFKQRQGIAFGAGMSLLAIFIYYGLIKFGQVLGFTGLLKPLVAVWFGNVIYLIGGILLLVKVRQ